MKAANAKTNPINGMIFHVLADECPPGTCTSPDVVEASQAGEVKAKIVTLPFKSEVSAAALFCLPRCIPKNINFIFWQAITSKLYEKGFIEINGSVAQEKYICEHEQFCVTPIEGMAIV